MATVVRRIIFVLALGASPAGNPSATARERELVVAVPAPLTGPRAAVGLAVHTAVAITAAEINAAGGVAGRLITVRLTDDPCSTAGGDQVMRHLATDSTVDVVIGHPCGPSARVASKLYAASSRMFVAAGGVPVRPAAGHIRLPSSKPMAEALAAMTVASAKERPHARIAIVRDRTLLNMAHAAAVEHAARAAGVAVVTEAITSGDREFGALARTLAANGTTHVALLAFAIEAGFAARTISEVIPAVTMFGPDHLGVPDFPQIAGDAMANVRVVMPATVEHYARISQSAGVLAKRLRGIGVEPAREALEAAAALQAWAQLTARAATADAAPLSLSLPTEPLATLLGPLAFDRQGDATLAYWVAHRWHGDGFVIE